MNRNTQKFRALRTKLRWQFRYRRFPIKVKRPIRVTIFLVAILMFIYWAIALILIQLGEMTYGAATSFSRFVMGASPLLAFWATGLFLVDGYFSIKKAKTHGKRINRFCLASMTITIGCDVLLDLFLRPANPAAYSMLHTIMIKLTIGILLLFALSALWLSYTAWLAYYRHHSTQSKINP